MIRVFGSFFLFLTLIAAQGQITFYGAPEPIVDLNSPSGENYLRLESTGNKVYFAREKHPANRGGIGDVADIWQSTLDSAWAYPEPLAVNDEHFASPLGVSADGQYFLYSKVWFDKTRFYGGVYAVHTSQPTEEIEVEIPFFQNRSPLQTGNLSADGRYLLLSLENSAGYGVDDLFVSFLRDDGTWSPVKNLGRNINTQFQELTPFLAADNRTLFFATNGRGGQGSFDLFKATRLDDTWQNWTEPESLGEPVNTSGAETSFAFVQGGEYAYFVSTQNSDGYGDIKRIRISSAIEEDTAREEMAPQIRIEEALERNPLTFELVNKQTGEAITGVAVVLNEEYSVTLVSNAGGQIIIPHSAENVSLEFKAPGFLSVRQTIDQIRFSVESQVVTEVQLEPLAEGHTITLQNVLFYRGTANFIEGSERELDIIADMMKENPDVRIFLKGHTDNVGNSVLNVQLSQERVEAVKNFLLAQGIDAGRITGKGFGGSEPIAPNDSEETRRLNRRVEFEIRRE